MGFERVPSERQGVAPAKDASREATVKASNPISEFFFEIRITISAGLGMTRGRITMSSSTHQMKQRLTESRQECDPTPAPQKNSNNIVAPILGSVIGGVMGNRVDQGAKNGPCQLGTRKWP